MPSMDLLQSGPMAYLPASSLIPHLPGRPFVLHPGSSYRGCLPSRLPKALPHLFSFLTSSQSTCGPQGVATGSWTLITGNALCYAFLSPQQQINSTYLSLSPRSVRVEQLFMERKGQGVMCDVQWLTAPFVFLATLQVR